MNYQETVDYIHSIHQFGKKDGLKHITILLEKLGNPHKGLKYIHIAGTNGKGSTSTMLSYILRESGYNTGLYISPYLERFNERIQLNNQQIPDDDLIRITQKVKDACEEMVKEGYPYPSEFEVVTTIGFCYYGEVRPDIICLEVGMGGKTDVTNVIESAEAAVICSISFDHTQYLGNTIYDIAAQKAGIIKEGYDVSVYGLNPKEAIDSILESAQKVHANVSICDIADIEFVSTDLETQTLRYVKKDSVLGVDTLTVALKGDFQIYNTLNVLNTCEILKKKGWNITSDAIEKGLGMTRFTGRFEFLNKEPVIVIDGGHNIEGITAFTQNVRKYFNKKIVLFYGMLADKQVDDSVGLLTKIAKKMYTVTPADHRAVDSEKMASIVRSYDSDIDVEAIVDMEEIVKYIDLSKTDEVYAFVGSLYMIGEARTIINNYLEGNK